MQPRKLILLCLPALLVGCGLLSKGRDIYLDSPQGAELRIPTGLDQPYTEARLTIPDGPPAEPVSASFYRPPSTLIAAIFDLPEFQGEELSYDDSAENVYRRIGLALERTEGVLVMERDPRGLGYRVQLAGRTATVERGWLRRVFGAEASSTTLPTPPVWVRVVAVDGRSKVEVRDESGGSVGDQRASRLLGVIQSRLG